VTSAPDKPWNYYMLTMNPNITWSEHIKPNLNLPWRLFWYINNPNCTVSDIIEIIEINNGAIEYDYFNVRLNYNPHFRSSHYRQKMTKRFHDQMYCELIARTCVTSRLFSWNEGAAEQMPAEYLAECARWREMRFTPL
jgi:hypothetical protein